MASLFEWLDTILQFLGTIAWPVVVAGLLLYVRTELKDLIDDLQGLRLGGRGVELNTARNADAVSNAVAATVNRQSSSNDDLDSLTEEIQSVVREVLDEGGAASFAGQTFLWVDDHPENNVYERETLEGLGADVIISRSSTDALEKIAHGSYDVVISDMSRPEGNRAGYDLLENLRDQGYQLPFLIYSGSNKQEHKVEARRRGAEGATSRPRELFHLIRQVSSQARFSHSP